MSTSQSPELMGGNLFGERDFASVSRAVEMGSFWIIQVSPNPMRRVLVRDRDWGDVATSPGLLESPPPPPPGAGRGGRGVKDPPLEPPGATWPCDTSISDFRVPECERRPVLSVPVCGHWLRPPQGTRALTLQSLTGRCPRGAGAALSKGQF